MPAIRKIICANFLVIDRYLLREFSLNLIAVKHALEPADNEHRFGHGKAEALSGVGQAMFIAGSAGFLLLQAIGRIINPQEMTTGLEVGVGVMVFSMVMTLALLSFQKYVVQQTGSTAIKADALHYKTDLLVNGSVIAVSYTHLTLPTNREV